MRLLAIDTVTEACSAALSIDGEIVSRFELARNRHSSRLLPMIEELLAEGGIELRQLDAVAFDRGPGSFTGLRIGAGVAQGIAFSVSVPVIGVSSLEILAAANPAPTVLPAIDARMGQVYWAVYASGDGESPMRQLSAERLDDPVAVATTAVPMLSAALAPTLAPTLAVGSGWDQYGETLVPTLGAIDVERRDGCVPDAATLARLAVARIARSGGIDAEDAVPVYLRDDVAVKKS